MKTPRLLSFGMCLIAALFSLGCQRVMYVDVQAAGESVDALKEKSRFALRESPLDQSQIDQLRARAEAMISEYLTSRGDPSIKPPYPLSSAKDLPRLGTDGAAKVKASLASRSMALDDANPQIIVHVAALSGRFHYEVSPRVKKGQPFGSGRAMSPDAGRWSSWPTETHAPYDGLDTAEGGNNADTDASALGITIVDAADPKKILWQGTAVSVGVYSDFDKTLDKLVDAALGEFPEPTTQPKRRKYPAN